MIRKFDEFIKKLNENHTDLDLQKSTAITDLPCLGAYNDDGVMVGVIESLEEDFAQDETDRNPDYKSMHNEMAKYLAADYIPKFIKDNLGIDVQFEYKNLQNKGYGVGYIIVAMTYRKYDIVELMNKYSDVVTKKIQEVGTTRDGYVAFYSNKFEDWKDLFLGTKVDEHIEEEDLANMASYILEVCMIENGLNSETMFYDLHEKFSGQFDFN
jgi:hypothetical protein